MSWLIAKKTNKIIILEYMLKYELGVFIQKFNKIVLPIINLRYYFNETDKIHNHKTKFSETN